MPPRSTHDPELTSLLLAQDYVISRDQARGHHMTPRAISHRLGLGRWRLVLPSVYIEQEAEPSRRQLLIAALLYTGEGTAIDGRDACRFHGAKAVAVDDERVQVVAPFGSPARSRDFVVVRRTTSPIRMVQTQAVRYVDAATAVIAATRTMRTRRTVLAVISDAIQRGVTTHEALVRAHAEGPPKGASLAAEALEATGAGVLSVAEADFRLLVRASTSLPEVRYNVLLRLPDKRLVCADALVVSSALIHETNGRTAHAREDLFEDMQERHDALTACGFIVLHNAPRRILTNGPAVIGQFERCHRLYAGRGLPPGVTILDSIAV